MAGGVFHVSAIFTLEGVAEPESLRTAELMLSAAQLAVEIGATYKPPDYHVRIITPRACYREERDAMREALVLLGVVGQVI